MVDQELEIPIVYDTFLAQKVHYLNKQWLIDSDRYGHGEGPFILFTLILKLMEGCMTA
jgi:hypothetical protein